MRMSTSFKPHSPSPGACLDDLLASRFLPRRWANRIWLASELPDPLERCTRTLVSHSEWRAYCYDDRILFAVARTHASDTRPGSGAALDVYFLDDSGSVYSAGVWEYDAKHGWWLDAVLDLSYDCEHGWWIDGLMDSQPSKDPHAGARLPKVVEFRKVAATFPKRSTDIPMGSRESGTRKERR